MLVGAGAAGAWIDGSAKRQAVHGRRRCVHDERRPDTPATPQRAAPARRPGPTRACRSSAAEPASSQAGCGQPAAHRAGGGASDDRSRNLATTMALTHAPIKAAVYCLTASVVRNRIATIQQPETTESALRRLAKRKFYLMEITACSKSHAVNIRVAMHKVYLFIYRFGYYIRFNPLCMIGVLRSLSR